MTLWMWQLMGKGPEEWLWQCLLSLSCPCASLLSGACDHLSLGTSHWPFTTRCGSWPHPAGTRNELLGLGEEEDCYCNKPPPQGPGSSSRASTRNQEWRLECWGPAVGAGNLAGTHGSVLSLQGISQWVFSYTSLGLSVFLCLRPYCPEFTWTHLYFSYWFVLVLLHSA